VIRGRVVSAKGEPIGGATIHACRNPDDPVASGEAQSAEDGTFVLGGLDAKRYFLRASKFGWLPETLKWAVTAPAARVGFKLARTGVIEGSVSTPTGKGSRTRPVVALLSGAWAPPARRSSGRVDSGKFAQDRFQAGTYYLWARHGEMLVVPAGEDRDQRPGAGRARSS
jgi:hypothetical protein